MRLPFFGSKNKQAPSDAPAAAPAAGSSLFATPDMSTFDPFSITPLAPLDPNSAPLPAEPPLPLDPWQEAGTTIPTGSSEEATADTLARRDAMIAAEAARHSAERERAAAARARETAEREAAEAEAIRLQAAREAAEASAAAAASIAAEEQAAAARIAAAETEMEQRIAARIAAAKAQVEAISTARIPYAVATERPVAGLPLEAAVVVETPVSSAPLAPVMGGERCIACGIDHAAASAIAAEREARERLFVAEQAIEAAERDLATARVTHAEALKAAIAETEALIAPARNAAKRKRGA